MKDSSYIAWADGAFTVPVLPDFEEVSELEQLRRDAKESDFARTICLQLFLWDEVAFGMGLEFMHNLLQLYYDRPSAADRLIRLMATNFEELKSSYSDLAAPKLTTKQNEEQQQAKDFKSILARFPQMRSLIDPHGKFDE